MDRRQSSRAATRRERCARAKRAESTSPTPFPARPSDPDPDPFPRLTMKSTTAAAPGRKPMPADQQGQVVACTAAGGDDPQQGAPSSSLPRLLHGLPSLGSRGERRGRGSSRGDGAAARPPRRAAPGRPHQAPGPVWGPRAVAPAPRGGQWQRGWRGTAWLGATGALRGRGDSNSMRKGGHPAMVHPAQPRPTRTWRSSVGNTSLECQHHPFIAVMPPPSLYS